MNLKKNRIKTCLVHAPIHRRKGAIIDRAIKAKNTKQKSVR